MKTISLPFLSKMTQRIGRPIYVLDLETTGFKSPGICEFAVLKSRVDGHIVCKSTLVNPQKRIDAGATGVHGISDKDVKDSKPFSAHLPFIDEIYSNGIVSGYNIITFDMRIIRENTQACRDEPVKEATALDVRNVWKGVSGTGKGKLVDVAAHYGVTLLKAHRAEADVLMTAAVLDAMIREHGEDTVLSHLRQVS